MRFSIVVPVYGTEEFLPRCLDAIVAQTDGDFEVIVVDDASQSSCSEIVARYDDRFKCIRHETNRSAFQARCTGVKAANGEYVVPVDPDDYLLPETLARLREVIDREDPDVVSYRMEYDNGQKVWPHWCRHPNSMVSGVQALHELVEHRYFTGVASKAFRRATLLSALSELKASEDLYVNTSDDFLMLVPALLKSQKVVFLDFAGYRYFVNVNSTSFSWRSAEGLRKACEQTRLAGDLVMAMAERFSEAPEIVLVRQLVSGLERWFARGVAEGPAAAIAEQGNVLLKCLHSENVAQEFIDQLQHLRASRTYRLGEALAQALRRFGICRRR